MSATFNVGDAQYVVAQQINRKGEWATIATKSARTREAAQNWIRANEAVDTTCGGLIAASQATIRYELRTCIVQAVEHVAGKRRGR